MVPGFGTPIISRPPDASRDGGGKSVNAIFFPETTPLTGDRAFIADQIDTQHLAWLKDMMPDAVDPKTYGPAFLDDSQFSPVLSDEASVSAAGDTLKIQGMHAKACSFQKIMPGVFKMHVVFDEAHAGAACAHFRGPDEEDDEDE